MLKPIIIKNVLPKDWSEKQVGIEFKKLINKGFQLDVKGQAKGRAPDYLPRTRPPKHVVDLFGVRYFLSDICREAGFRFFVAYLVMPQNGKHLKRIYPRIFYKDSSLIWRSASHLIKTGKEHWIGKGDLKPIVEDGEINYYSAEETTNLPYEMDAALDTISRSSAEVIVDKLAQEMVLRNAPEHRVEPYADFTQPRRKAMQNPKYAINQNKKIAWFNNADKPSSLRIETGFEPDFKNGLIDTSASRSKMYGGEINKYRIASKNRQVQYLFITGLTQAWIIPPQPLDNLIISYGVRAVDAEIDDNLCIPGFEFHYLEFDDEPDSLYSQIPKGFVGPASEADPDRASASPWIEELPVMKKFRKHMNQKTLGSINSNEISSPE